MKLYKEVINGIHITSNEQEVGLVLKSSLVEATEEEVEKAKSDFIKNKKCTHHFTYDKPCWIYDDRICGICKRHIAFI